MEKNLSILIVDDDAVLADSLTDIFVAKGYDARFVTSGSEALIIIKKYNFDILFIDFKMPEMNGVETLKQIKVQFPLALVVMVTAYAEDALVKQAIQEGALQILQKPLDIAKTLKVLEELRSLKTIFIIDDNVAFCNALKDTFSVYRYEVIVAHSAQEAIESLSTMEKGIILLDIKLNGKSGLEVAETIRGKGCKCDIILMSAYKKKSQSSLYKTKKIEGFLEKPFQIDEIFTILSEISEKKLIEILV